MEGSKEDVFIAKLDVISAQLNSIIKIMVQYINKDQNMTLDDMVAKLEVRKKVPLRQL